jgi:hypothetical protein
MNTSMRKARLRGRTLRYTGPLKVVETTGQWGVYAGERIVLGDGRALDDDLGMKLRKAFQPGAADAHSRHGALPEAFELKEVQIEIRVRRR